MAYLKSKGWLTRFFNLVLVILFIPIMINSYLPSQYQQIIEYRNSLILEFPYQINIGEILEEDISKFEVSIAQLVEDITG